MSKILVVFLALFTLAACGDVQHTIIQKKEGIVAILGEKGKEAGVGTGFFIDENFIVTNNHVVEDTTKLEVAMENSKKTYPAEVVYKDKMSDVAVVRIKDWETFKKENKYILLTMTTKYELLDEVYAVGHPWGLFWSISKGVVSRDLMQAPDTRGSFLLQTDAHVYNGNSGGPLLNTKGEVIGINSMMIAREGGSYGLAIPTSIVKKVLSDLEKYKEVRWPLIGVTLEGNTIKEISEDKPAAKAGLKVGDVIVSVKTKKGLVITTDSETLIYALSVNDYEDQVLVNIDRNGELITVSVQPTYKIG